MRGLFRGSSSCHHHHSPHFVVVEQKNESVGGGEEGHEGRKEGHGKVCVVFRHECYHLYIALHCRKMDELREGINKERIEMQR